MSEDTPEIVPGYIRRGRRNSKPVLVSLSEDAQNFIKMMRAKYPKFNLSKYFEDVILNRHQVTVESQPLTIIKMKMAGTQKQFRETLKIFKSMYNNFLILIDPYTPHQYDIYEVEGLSRDDAIKLLRDYIVKNVWSEHKANQLKDSIDHILLKDAKNVSNPA